MKLMAVVFDFDGVIIDTEKARYDAMQEIYSSFGQILSLDVWIKSVGHASYAVDPYRLLTELTGKELNHDELKKKHKEIEMEIADTLPVLPGVIDRIEEVRKLGGRLAIASSSSKQWVEGHLEKRDLLKYFDFTICKNDTIRHKPDPEPYLNAIKRLGCNHNNAFAIEDSPIGIEAAKSAGLICIAVGCTLTKDLDLSRADYRFNSMEEFTLFDLSRELLIK